MEPAKKKVIYLSPDVQPVAADPVLGGSASVTLENTQPISGGSDDLTAEEYDVDSSSYSQDGEPFKGGYSK